MSIWGGITGGLLGFAVLGPIGALVGSVIGSRISGNSSRKRLNNFDRQVAFFAALFACLAKLAKADGRVDEAEVQKIEEIISKKLNLSGEHRNFAINIFQKAKDDKNSFEAYASNLYKILSSSPNSLLVFYEILFELALADGILHPKEDELLKKIPHIFNFDQSVYDNFYEKYVSQNKSYYKVLGVKENSPFEDIKKSYLKKRKEFHPDTLIGKGLPEEFIEKAKEKFIEIQEAYEELEKIHQK
ncbi:MAG: molecular chaperone DjlA [Gammaproteobacteria bacterium]|nr:MAG: molecular chaperone DjlA [Gammaproteobacteria bacterium]|tara:strand:- start:332 stop:1063 length:732 start_codon:yes stop_codon:yes gene_type:complete